MDKYMETTNAQITVERNHEWRKWMLEIPYIAFPAEWEVKIVPPFTGAIVRFWIRPKGNEKIHCSIYLDCYDVLGCYGKPYWEVYPHDSDIFRCDMNDTEALLNAIKESFEQQSKGG